MNQSDKISGRRRAGRPRIEDRDQILSYFSSRISEGYSIYKIAKSGLIINDYYDEEAKMFMGSARALKGATLERRYRELLKEQNDAFDEMTMACRAEGVRFIGMSMPKPSSSFVHGRVLKRGRPKKRSV